ncbi:hypothetical protein [Simkania sp.]|uniref:hypothetical protein n=1 Tax=Simkania sp. TaxID=34094 RepID=UPI003B51C15D
MTELAHSAAERLIYNHSSGQKILADIQGNSIIIYDEVLRNNMREIGVSIPPAFQKTFGGKKIHLSEGDQSKFIQAFKDFYCRGAPSNSYQWIPLYPQNYR